MKFSISRQALLKPLQLTAGVVERRQTLPILSNVLVRLKNNQLKLTTTDLEIELHGVVNVDSVREEGETTLPARTLLDICRSLSDDAQLTFQLDEKHSRTIIKANKSRFSLATLPAKDFPRMEDEGPNELEFSLPANQLRSLMEQTRFAMAQQDVRYYLNGMLLELDNQGLQSVAADGHRLALAKISYELDVANPISVIIPRKSVSEILRLIASEAQDGDDKSESKLTIGLNQSSLSIIGPDFSFLSKLVDGKFPSYQTIIPRNNDKKIVLDRDSFKSVLTRMAILSTDKYKGIRFQLRENLLRLIANNPEQEEAEEELEIDYTGADLDIGFNISYLIDFVNNISETELTIYLSDTKTSALLESNPNHSYIIMPMRL